MNQMLKPGPAIIDRTIHVATMNLCSVCWGTLLRRKTETGAYEVYCPAHGVGSRVPTYIEENFRTALRSIKYADDNTLTTLVLGIHRSAFRDRYAIPERYLDMLKDALPGRCWQCGKRDNERHDLGCAVSRQVYEEYLETCREIGWNVQQTRVFLRDHNHDHYLALDAVRKVDPSYDPAGWHGGAPTHRDTKQVMAMLFPANPLTLKR